MWRGVREVEEGPNCTSERPRKAQPWRPLSSGGHCTDSWQCGQTGAKTIPLLWWQSFPPVASKPPNLVTSCFNGVTEAVAAGWQISRIKVVKRSRGQMERVELYWPKTQTMFLMNFRVKHTSLSLIIHSSGTVHLNHWPGCSKVGGDKKRPPIKIISSRCWRRCIRDRNIFPPPFTSEKFISPR